MGSTVPEVVDTNMFDRPHQRRPQTVHMSYSDIARSSGSLLSQSQNNSQDDASVDTTTSSNVVKLPQPQLRTRTYTQTGQGTLIATQVRADLLHAYAVTYQNRITDKP
jgi:hypothetical protein